MKLKKNQVAEALTASLSTGVRGFHGPTGATHCRNEDSLLTATDSMHPEMERRLRARHVWEFLDESKSTFYARMNVNEESYDPLFPQPIPMSSTGKGSGRWKLGAVIEWLRICEAAANKL
ncbi:MAG: hypothetical protein ABI114_14215 [Rhodanobacter sp.]